jgi:hypothetical protein
MSNEDETVPEAVIAKLWPELETRPAWAKRCRHCGLIYTSGRHDSECPELGWTRDR